jgi:hypothetical protein
MKTQAGLFSAILTAFIIDSKQNLKVNPTDQMVYYLQQNVAMLDQISRQISSIAPQFSIPSAPPSPFPAFNPLASDIIVNAFWFMALVFSLSAALLATLVQQWVRDYMHVFQRYSDPLKSARLRQYLYEGSERLYMPLVAEAVPCLLHVSLFLFLIGLCDSVFNVNTAVGFSTTIPIAIISLLYILTTFAPAIYPQSPYQTSFSGRIWSTMQRIRRRRFKDRNFKGELKPVSLNMVRGKMQLAMEETEGRKGRDERAVQWLASNMTEDAEMESFVMAIPGSFNVEWGEEVWKKVSKSKEDKDKDPRQDEPSFLQSILPSFIPLVGSHPASDSGVNPTPHVQGEHTVRELSGRVRHLLDTCKNRGLFTSDELWRRRTRACIETTASLVCCVGVELGQFGDMLKLLGDIGSDQTVRESSAVGKEQSFVMRWTCLSLVAIRPVLESNWLLHNDARLASQRLERRDNTGDQEQTPARVDTIIEGLNKALGGLKTLSDALTWGGDQTEERVKEILRDHDSQILELEQIDIENAAFQLDDWSISSVQRSIDRITHGVITSQLPGVKSDVSDVESVNFGQFVELFRDPHALLFIFPLRNLTRIRFFAQTLRKFIKGENSADTFQKTIKDLREFGSLSNRLDKPVLRQVWRMQDLSGGGGLGFTVELFFLVFKQLLSTSSLKESHSGLYIGTFRAITSDWSKYKISLGTQRLLLNMVAPHHGIIFSFDYPDYIIDEFLAFLGDVLDGQTGSHIDDVVQQLTTFPTYLPRYTLSVKALNALSGHGHRLRRLRSIPI